MSHNSGTKCSCTDATNPVEATDAIAQSEKSSFATNIRDRRFLLCRLWRKTPERAPTVGGAGEWTGLSPAGVGIDPYGSMGRV